MQQALEQQSQQMEEMNKYIQEVGGENADMKQKSQDFVIKAMADLEKTRMTNETSMRREKERQEGKKEGIILQGAVNMKLAKAQAGNRNSVKE